MDDVKVPGTAKTPDPAEKLQKVRVLVVDSSTQAADLIKNIFGQLGFPNVLVANDIYESIQIMKRIRVDMIFADWGMKAGYNPQIYAGGALAHKVAVNGAQYVKNLRFSPSSPNPFIPVVMLMGAVTDRDIVGVRDSGVNDIILKPLEAHEFCHKIVALIDRPRIFITASSYKGPCRRIDNAAEFVGKERRKRQVRLVRRSEQSAQKGR
jgi:two-component system, chemotaxis family, chemotaxis protein CheY